MWVLGSGWMKTTATVIDFPPASDGGGDSRTTHEEEVLLVVETETAGRSVAA